MKAYERIVTTKEFSSIFEKSKGLFECGTLRFSDMWKDGEKVRGKRVVSFTPYINPIISPEENHTILSRDFSVVRGIFPSYNLPSLSEIKGVFSNRLRSHKAIMKAGVIAEKSLPKASEVWFSGIK